MVASELLPGEFVLDTRIALWALLPISVATLCMALLRQSLTVLGTDRVPETLPKIRDSTMLGRSANLRISGSLIAKEQFLVRKSYFVNERTGVLAKPRPNPTATSAAALMSPQTMANQVTGTLSMLLPQMIMGAWARYLFAGTAVCRLPFMLSERFRSMLQTGIEAAGQGVGVQYVSALSWYILNLFGNSAAVYVLTYKGDRQQNQPSLGAQIALSMNPGKVFSDERKSLLAVNHRDFLDKLEDKLILS